MGTKEVIFICSGDFSEKIIQYIEENRGKLNWCIVYCLEKNDYKELKEEFPDTVFDVIDHPRKMAITLNSCH